MTKPPRVPAALWKTLSRAEQAKIAPKDGGYEVCIPSGPNQCHYFTTWNKEGRALATYDLTAEGWVLRKRWRKK